MTTTVFVLQIQPLCWSWNNVTSTVVENMPQSADDHVDNCDSYDNAENYGDADNYAPR